MSSPRILQEDLPKASDSGLNEALFNTRDRIQTTSQPLSFDASKIALNSPERLTETEVCGCTSLYYYLFMLNHDVAGRHRRGSGVGAALS